MDIFICLKADGGSATFGDGETSGNSALAACGNIYFCMFPLMSLHPIPDGGSSGGGGGEGM